jgi:hypothetical protein
VTLLTLLRAPVAAPALRPAGFAEPAGVGYVMAVRRSTAPSVGRTGRRLAVAAGVAGAGRQGAQGATTGATGRAVAAGAVMVGPMEREPAAGGPVAGSF